MSQTELAEHLSYITDDVKLDRFRRALEAVIRPTDTVLDLGAGTGLLGFIALGCGAHRVVAVDAGRIASIVHELAARNGLAERVEVVREKSTALDVPGGVDVIIADQLGGVGFDAGINRFFADAARRLLNPGGRTVPSAYDLCFGAVQAPSAARSWDAWSAEVHGLDLSPVRSYAVNTPWPVQLDRSHLLSDVVRAITIDALDDSDLRCEVTLDVSQPGVLHGVVGCFRANMAPGISMTNDPSDDDRMRHRWQNLYPIERAVGVRCGDQVYVEFRGSPETDAMSWKVTVERPGSGTLASSQHSSLLGRFLTKDDLR